MKAGSTHRGLQVLLVSLVFLLLGFAWLVRVSYSSPAVAPELSLDKVYELAAGGQIRTAKLLDEDALVIGQRCVVRESVGPGPGSSPLSVEGVAGSELRREAPSLRSNSCLPPLKPFQASYPQSDVSTQQLIERMAAGGAQVVVDKQRETAVMKLLATFLFPLLVLANLFGIIFLSRGANSSITEIAGFGRISRRRHREQRVGTGVTFADVGGAQEAVSELREVTDYLKDPKKFQAYGAAAPKGVLLFGPPGCGKTLLARAVAGDAAVPFFSVSGAEFVESLVGVGAARVRDLFRLVRDVAPAIVFIDEIDAVGRKRSGEGLTGGEREQTVNQLLIEIDGFEVSAGVVVMGATNRPDILDPALLRPGRFDRHVILDPPDVQGRKEILQLHARGKPLGSGADFDQLAKKTSGFTGADLANVVNEAALLAIREGAGTKIDQKHLSEAVQRVLHGPQRRGKLMSASERRRLAFHEAGHAVAASAFEETTGVDRVSIVARSRGIGSSSIENQADRVLLTGTEMKDRLVITMAGIAAEELVFGDSSTTAQEDIAIANALAREMVGLYGMSEEVGPLHLLASQNGLLGSDMLINDAISGETLSAFDREVRRLIEDARATASNALKLNRGTLDLLVTALEEEETIEGPALQDLLRRVDLKVLGQSASPPKQTLGGSMSKRYGKAGQQTESR